MARKRVKVHIGVFFLHEAQNNKINNNKKEKER